LKAFEEAVHFIVISDEMEIERTGFQGENEPLPQIEAALVNAGS
jgi:hypothetical protein